MSTTHFDLSLTTRKRCERTNMDVLMFLSVDAFGYINKASCHVDSSPRANVFLLLILQLLISNEDTFVYLTILHSVR
jgi:hypothetical protein